METKKLNKAGRQGEISPGRKEKIRSHTGRGREKETKYEIGKKRTEVERLQEIEKEV